MLSYAISTMALFSVCTLASVIPRSSDVKVLYRWEMKTGEQGISAFDNSGSLLDMACGSSSLRRDSFATHPIQFTMSQGSV